MPEQENLLFCRYAPGCMEYEQGEMKKLWSQRMTHVHGPVHETLLCSESSCNGNYLWHYSVI